MSHQHQKMSTRKAVTGTGWILLTFLLTYVSLVNGLVYKQPISWSEDDISSFFGAYGCVTGELVAMASQPVVVPPLQDSTVTCGAGGDECPPSSDTTQEKEHQQGPELANSKEKTPMCLVNELARFNKITHQYRLTGEQGPPHQKKFMVTLKLGDEEYSAEGASIKKAQHAAASYALTVTNYEHPPPKASKNSRLSKGNITPTVELNALAMRRGEPTTYTILQPTSHHQHFNYHHRGMYTQPRSYSNYGDYSRRGMPTRLNHGSSQRYDNQRYGMKGAPLYTVSVKVGEREFTGEGPTAQAARHDAASKALDELRNLPVDTNRTCKAYTVEGVGLETDSSSDLKSPISLVHEVALKRNLTVTFEVIDEKGPPHMRTFVTRCRVGDTFETTGEGNGKKISKKRAAEKMLEELRSLPPTTVVNACGLGGSLSRMKRKANAAKKKSRNLIRETNTNIVQEKTDAETPVDEINPISRLIQIQQAKKEKEPVYTLKEERGQARRREFLMEVTVGEYSFVGSGPNKKLAKRNAAEGMLQEMGYSTPSSGIRKQVTFMNGEKSANVGGSGGRQLVPGLLLMTDNSRSSSSSSSNNQNKASPGGGSSNMQATVQLVKDYLNGGSMPHSNDVRGNHKSSGTGTSHAVRPKEQLLYLAKLLGFKVQFSDFPKGNHSEYLSLVSLSTEPPQVCHGSGKTTENSHDQASLTALRALAEMGLDSVSSSIKKESSIGPGSDQMFMSSGGTSNSMAGKTSFVNGASGK